jgi:hypothetical protein
MSNYKPIAAAATLAATLLIATTVSAFDSVDECINEKTFECLDADDFWDCYDWIVEGCNDQTYPLVVPPKPGFGRIKADTGPLQHSLVESDADSFQRR